MLSAECLSPLYAKVSSNPDVDTKTVSDTFGYRFFHKNASLSGNVIKLRKSSKEIRSKIKGIEHTPDRIYQKKA